MLISSNLHKKGSEVSIKTRSTPASYSYEGQATKYITVKWSIIYNDYHELGFYCARKLFCTNVSASVETKGHKVPFKVHTPLAQNMYDQNFV